MRRTWPSVYGRRALAEWIVNLGEAAEYMFDHNIYQDNLVGVDFCEQMVKETNPERVGRRLQSTPLSPHSDKHGYKTICRHHDGAQSVHRERSTARRWP